MAKVYQMPAKKPRPPAAHHRGRLIGIIVAAVALVLVLFVLFLLAYTDWLWFGEVGLRVVFWRQVWSRLVVGVVAGAIFFAIFYANVELARRLSPRHRAFEGIDVVEYVNERTVQGLRRGGLVVSVVIAIIVGASASGQWLLFQKALHGVSFHSTDPIFHHDLGFYIFTLPAWQAVYGLIMGALIAGLVAAVVIHGALGGLVLTQERPAPPSGGEAERPTRGPFGPGGPFARPAGQPSIGFVVRPRSQSVAHLSVLLGIIFALAGVGYLFKAWNLLFSSNGVVAGAGYTDIHAGLPGMRFMLAFGVVLGAVLIANGFWRRRWRWPLYAVGGWVVALIVVRVAFPAVMQSLIVSPNQQAKEGPYIAHNIAATRKAYGLNQIIPESVSADRRPEHGQAGRQRRHHPQHPPLGPAHAAGQLRPAAEAQELLRVLHRWGRPLRRERRLPRDHAGAARAEHRRPAGAVADLGQPAPHLHPRLRGRGVGGQPGHLGRLARLPRAGRAADLDGARPGDHPAAHLLRPDGQQLHAGRHQDPRVRLPGGSGGGDVYTHYNGSGGIPINSFLNRLAFTVRFGTIRFFTASSIYSPSRIIIRNNIVARLHAAAPFLTFDQDPYMVLADGRLFWIVDAYTTSAAIRTRSRTAGSTTSATRSKPSWTPTPGRRSCT